MEKNYKLLFLTDGRIIITEISDKNEHWFYLKNPMIIEYKYNTENSPVFRYVPWQILSEDETTEISKTNITMITKPKTELLDVYQRICISFIPLEEDDEDE